MPQSASARIMMSKKIKEVMHKGIRGKKVSKKQAIAVAYSAARKKGYKA